MCTMIKQYIGVGASEQRKHHKTVRCFILKQNITTRSYEVHSA